MSAILRQSFLIPGANWQLEGHQGSNLLRVGVGALWGWNGAALTVNQFLDQSRSCTEDALDFSEVLLRLSGLVEIGGRLPLDLLDLASTNPELRNAFVVSDGARFYTLVPLPGIYAAEPMILALGELPPAGCRLTVSHCVSEVVQSPVNAPSSAICFTPGTRLRTEAGDVAIEKVRPGDLILTRDSGVQEVRWRGVRRMSGARLFANPNERPVRLRSGALGKDRPDVDLILSPEHCVLVKDHAARDLFGEKEVFVRAADLVGDPFVAVDNSLRETYYIHLMLEKHEVVWANGLEVESFYPGSAALSGLTASQRADLSDLRPDLLQGARAYGAPARRMLSSGEAGIMLGAAV